MSGGDVTADAWQGPAPLHPLLGSPPAHSQSPAEPNPPWPMGIPDYIPWPVVKRILSTPAFAEGERQHFMRPYTTPNYPGEEKALTTGTRRDDALFQALGAMILNGPRTIPQ